MDIATLLNGATVCITGGTGSLAQALTATLLRDYSPRQVRILSRGWLRQAEMQRQWPESPTSPIRYLIGDVRSEPRLEQAFEDCQIVIHAAALKDIVSCERNPGEAKATNTDGTENAVRAAKRQGVERFMFISTDKAAAPLNVYGVTKAAAEKYVVAANNVAGPHGPIYSACRYGNVAASNGSVIPVWREQARTGELTLTHEGATRFIITLEQAVAFVLSSLALARGGEIFIPRLPSLRLLDLARAMAPDARLSVTGLRAGEKLHEMMVTPEESRHCFDLGDRYALLPALSWQARSQWPEARPVPEGWGYCSGTNDEWLDPMALLEVASATG